MARILAVDGVPALNVEGPWHLVVTPPGACATPRDLPGEGWIQARVPGTAAASLREAGLWSEAAPTPLHESDIWYRATLSGTGRERLRFEGLATIAEIWIDGVLAGTSRSMLLAQEVEADLSGETEIALCFRSLSAELARPHKRGRWRPLLATPGSLRHIRTSLLGFMPGWCPSIDSVGPYRPVTRKGLRGDDVDIASVDLRTALNGGTGRLTVRIELDGVAEGPAFLICDGREVALRQVAPGGFEGELLLPDIAPWWPHTHGEPRLHAVEADIAGRRLDLGRVGFRTLALTRPFEEGLGLAINGVPVFCRGACWTPPDLVGLPGDRDSYRPLLDLAREAGMNMLRVPGITLYEASAFHDLCDELGILVWQDLMLANFDYPTDDPGFCAALVEEITQFLDRTQTSPSLCVLSGGSEVWQQAAMLGFPREVWAGSFAAEVLPDLVARARPDLVVVPNSPSGGDLPFSTSAGVTHYYGVGAYRRPFEDARLAEVGFASECLAFANVPDATTLAECGLTDPTSPHWPVGIPRDRGADWDFEGVRDHYVATLFGADPERLRRENPERYLALGRAASGVCMEAVFAEWRRARSPNAGGLVWFFRDLAPGPGWGVVDCLGRPKPAWYALKRAFRPVQVTLSDEGLNGLHAHVHNETAQRLDATLRLAFTDADGRVVIGAERAIEVGPRSSASWSSAELLGRFFDATHAYRFGPPAHRLGHASLIKAGTGEVIAEAFHYPQGRDPEPRELGLSAELMRNGTGWALRIATGRHALGVRIEISTGRPSDNWFSLAPGATRIVPLFGTVQTGDTPTGHVGALNGIAIARFGRGD
ncbi:glycoside hydrolase family 2 protein [Methylobacterium sp. W2]|uniref:glycoside hydrolase family 2 protein n=1 Tax=Methylobacterium sp. W2 TaxID=2598107 RepID=UPI001D0CC880|nr:glycoside hydrolase family 2 protein [Methylobacterium sp. W2]MCC0804643.1 glycoside hydrolase family 2 protein [Methylobacterium sp. W2]